MSRSAKLSAEDVWRCDIRRAMGLSLRQQVTEMAALGVSVSEFTVRRALARSGPYAGVPLYDLKSARAAVAQALARAQARRRV